jgi:hypothetical protein
MDKPMAANSQEYLEHRALDPTSRWLDLTWCFLQALRTSPPDPAAVFQSFAALEQAHDGREIADLEWQRMVFHGLNGVVRLPPEEREKFFARLQQHIFLLLKTQRQRATTLRKLLDFLFSSYQEEIQGFKGLLIGELVQHLHLLSPNQHHEMIDVLIHQRRIFELPFPAQQVEMVVGAITRLRQQDGQTSGRIQRHLATRWLVAGQDQDVPAVTRRAVRSRLRQVDFKTIEDIFVTSLYQQLEVGVESELDGILELLAAWYPQLEVSDQAQQIALINRYHEYRSRSDLPFFDTNSLEFKLLAANSIVLRSMVEKLDTWSGRPQITVKVLEVLGWLACTREHGDRLIAWLQAHPDPADSRLMEAIINVFSRVINGADARIFNGEEDSSDAQRIPQLPNLQQIQQKDRGPIEFLFTILEDMSYPPAVRRKALLALVKIYPPELGGRLGKYLDDHPDWDVIHSVVLEAIRDLKLQECWPALHRALAGWKDANQYVVLDLVKTAGIVGAPGIVEALIPLAFDATDELLRRTAKEALLLAGYDLAYQLEEIRRKIIDLDRQLSRARQERQESRQQGIEAELVLMDLERQVSLGMLNAAESQQDVDLTVVNYKIDYSDIHLQLVEVDRQVQALLERIKVLSDRQVKLNLELQTVVEKIQGLQDSCDLINGKIRQRKEQENSIVADQKSCHEKITWLEGEIQRRTLEAAQRQNFMREVQDHESGSQRRLDLETQNLAIEYAQAQAQTRSYEFQVMSAELSSRQAQADVNRLRDQLESLRLRIQFVQSTSVRNQVLAQIGDLERRLAAARDRLEATNQNARSVTGQLSTLRQQLLSKEARQNQIKGELNLSRERVDQARQRVAEIHAMLENFRTQQKDLNLRMLELHEKIETHRRAIAELEGEAGILRGQIDKLAAQARTHQENLRVVVQELQQVKASLDHWRREKERVERLAEQTRSRYHQQYFDQDGKINSTIQHTQEVNTRIENQASLLKLTYEQIHTQDEKISQLDVQLTEARQEFVHANEESASQMGLSAQRHQRESAGLRLEHDRRQLIRLGFAFYLGRAGAAFLEREPRWLERRYLPDALQPAQPPVMVLEKRESEELR